MMTHLTDSKVYQNLKDIQMNLKAFAQGTVAHVFYEGSCRLTEFIELEAQLNESYFEMRSVEELMAENHKLYKELLPENYGKSIANPVYACEICGEELGQILSYLYAQIYKGIELCFEHKTEELLEIGALVERVYQGVVVEMKALEMVKSDIKKHVMDTRSAHYNRQLKQRCCSENQHLNNSILESDLTNPKYLFKFGVYITPHELRTSQFMRDYDEKELDKLAHAIAKAYVSGFKRDNKNISLRHAVRVVGVAGQEILTKRVMNHLATYNLKPYVNLICSTEYNKQFEFDHKFDSGIYLDQPCNDHMIKAYTEAAESQSLILSDYSGILYIEKFGEVPFTPVNNCARIKLDNVQQGLSQSFPIETSQILEKFTPESERSFCIVAFPSPEIGENFEEIFADVVKINQMDSEAHEKIQQVIIDALDLGEYVHVKGYNGNLTDIRVKLQKLKDPKTQTNFVNCVADVNIPVGEVFTSPELKGTSGVLHVNPVYLDNFNYDNLKLTFEDGNIVDYNCTNFEDAEKNKEYIRENLLFPHQSLPIGEFAIGTNTLAYVISEKHGIVDKLPVLIVEKMGPHFAIGDTCFSWSEDNPVFNPTDGKEIMARDNERSILRKEDVKKAYTNVHTDITIPYDSLEHITVIKETGEAVEIIRHGRFVLAGTEALNEPFEGL